MNVAHILGIVLIAIPFLVILGIALRALGARDTALMLALVVATVACLSAGTALVAK
jgi:hypothetical protein